MLLRNCRNDRLCVEHDLLELKITRVVRAQGEITLPGFQLYENFFARALCQDETHLRMSSAKHTQQVRHPSLAHRVQERKGNLSTTWIALFDQLPTSTAQIRER